MAKKDSNASEIMLSINYKLSRFFKAVHNWLFKYSYMQFSSISTQIQQHREKNQYICSKQDLQLQYSSIEMFKVKRQKKTCWENLWKSTVGIYFYQKKMAFKAKDIIKDNVTQNRMLNGIIL